MTDQYEILETVAKAFETEAGDRTFTGIEVAQQLRQMQTTIRLVESMVNQGVRPAKIDPETGRIIPE